MGNELPQAALAVTEVPGKAFKAIIGGAGKAGAGVEGEGGGGRGLEGADLARWTRQVLELGIDTVDLADIYGGYTAEGLLGTALKANPSLRQQMEIVSKCDIVIDAGRHSGARVKHYNTTAEHINASVDASLTAMGIDEIDVLLIHRPDPLMNHLETGAALDALIDTGKARAVGASNFRPWDWELLQSAMRHRLVTNQIELSLKAISPFTNGDLAFHQQRDHVVMAWSPLGGGDLMTGSSELTSRLDRLAARLEVERAAVATAFLLAHPARITPVLGTNNINRIFLNK